ncbi:Dabb family protein [Halalkalibacter krulwichiae]|uniref:Stress responsive A/B Barrel Domain protein n=1 Tax=Halalkalibacter krulwichiae TaxID=199441 RepID=A0A1X9MBE2_9BACI|nr:Dabb family protein [Halalkalibacter krulwichiae]ARK29910.1 Stress responsive A/B Barrel Domain protein [Halalkalibacter krulwichiae]
MIQHIVLVKFKNKIAVEQREELIQKSKKLKEHIVGIIDIQQGFNFSDRNQGYEYAATILFKDKHALEQFGSHPKHLDVVSYLREIGLDDIVVVDFETEYPFK